MQIKVVALCDILRGPTEMVNVFASADIAQYAVDKQVIDFGQQVSRLSILISSFVTFLKISTYPIINFYL